MDRVGWVSGHAYDPSTQEAETRGSGVLGQPGLCKKDPVLKKQGQARHQWITPVRLPIGRLQSGGLRLKASLGRKSVRPHLNQQLGAVACVCHPKLHGRLRSGGLQFPFSLGVESPPQPQI
jgi:hypothetical protein